MKPLMYLRSVPVMLLAFLSACSSSSNQPVAEDDSTLYKMVNEPDSSAWISLFNGINLEGWHGFNKTETVSNWMVEDSVLVCLGVAEGDTGGDLVSDEEFRDFELEWEWKISKGGNSGLMYHVIESDKYAAPYETGPEYQLIDDKGFLSKLEPWQTAGADYAMHAAPATKKLNPAGEWNTSKIIFNEGNVEHWLNGEKIIAFEAWSDAWEKEKTTGKWKDFPDYGSAKKGRIALQDHGDKVWFRNIRIRKL